MDNDKTIEKLINSERYYSLFLNGEGGYGGYKDYYSSKENFENNKEDELLQQGEFLTMFVNNNSQCFSEELVKSLYKENKLKIGTQLDYIFTSLTDYGYKLFLDKISINSIKEYHKGENILIVEDVLKRLNGGFFDDWKFEWRDIDFFEIGYNKKKHFVYNTLNYEVGNKLYIEKENVGKIILVEDKDSIDNRIKIWKIERYEDGKKGLGKSILTILNRVCKGNDIVIELTVGDIVTGNSNEKINKITMDKNKLYEIYQSRGFIKNKKLSVDSSMVVLDNQKMVDDYINSLED